MIIVNKKQTITKADLTDVIMDLVIKLHKIDDNKYTGSIKRIFDFYKVKYTQRKYR